MRLCPLCQKPLVKAPRRDHGFGDPEWYCQEEVKFPGDKRIFNHYSESPELNFITMYIQPYRIQTNMDEPRITRVGTHSRYKTKRGVRTNVGDFYFKTILKCPELHPDIEEKLRSRIKLLLVMS